MKNLVSIILEIIGIIILAIGYQKSNRNYMLLGAILLWAGGSTNDFVHGYIAGHKAAISHLAA